MADQQKCCETCRWAEPLFDSHPNLRSCEAPAPNSTRGYGRACMSIHDGKDCPCYQPQETNDDE